MAGLASGSSSPSEMGTQRQMRGAAMHEGVAYPTRDEAAETARLLAWVGAAAQNYRDEAVPQAAVGSGRQQSGPDL